MKKRVLELIDIFENDNPGCEAIALYQDGEIIIDHRFKKSPPRLIYSHTKSFISTLCGMAIDEGKLSLDDKLADFFPEYESVITDERVKEIKLRHLLTMSSGFGGAFLMGGNRRGGEGFPDYIRYMLSKEAKYAAGEKFVYSNADTHLAGCMAERALGKPLYIYACENLFSKLGIGYPTWEMCPHGTIFGGSGLYLDILDMMKLGILYLHGGEWNGEQIVSKSWVESAGTKKISTDVNTDWSGGYGYQFWTIEGRDGAFRADGAYGQLSIVLPDSNAVLATQCSEYNDQAKFFDLLLKTCIYA